MLEAEAEAAEAAIIANAASSCGDRMSRVSDVAPSMESREKVDVFLYSITGNNDEPDFDQNHGASATALKNGFRIDPFRRWEAQQDGLFSRHH